MLIVYFDQIMLMSSTQWWKIAPEVLEWGELVSEQGVKINSESRCSGWCLLVVVLLQRRTAHLQGATSTRNASPNISRHLYRPSWTLDGIARFLTFNKDTESSRELKVSQMSVGSYHGQPGAATNFCLHQHGQSSVISRQSVSRSTARTCNYYGIIHCVPDI